MNSKKTDETTATTTDVKAPRATSGRRAAAGDDSPTLAAVATAEARGSSRPVHDRTGDHVHVRVAQLLQHGGREQIRDEPVGDSPGAARPAGPSFRRESVRHAPLSSYRARRRAPARTRSRIPSRVGRRRGRSPAAARRSGTRSTRRPTDSRRCSPALRRRAAPRARRRSADVAIGRVLEQRRRQAGFLVKSLGELEHQQRAVADGGEVRIGAADFDVAPLEDRRPVLRRDFAGVFGLGGVGDDHPVAREVGVPGGVLRNEVAREDVGVGQEQDVGNAVQVRDLAHVLERGAAFPLNHDPRLRGKRVENGLQRFVKLAATKSTRVSAAARSPIMA